MKLGPTWNASAACHELDMIVFSRRGREGNKMYACTATQEQTRAGTGESEIVCA